MSQLERTARFVAPLPEDRRPIVPGARGQSPIAEVLPPADLPALLPTATSHVELRTGYTDRAKGFQLATVPVALAFGVGVLVVAVVGFSVPAFSVAALALFWVAFLAWWLVGWAIHHLISPDGAALLGAILQYRYLRHEQRERLRRYGLARAKHDGLQKGGER